MDHINALLVEITLIGAALAALTQWVFRPMFKAIRNVIRAANYVSDEMSFDSGSTMRDAIERLEHVNMLFAEKLGVEIPDHLLPRHDENNEHSSHKKGTHPT
jgi:hypothetical protein